MEFPKSRILSTKQLIRQIIESNQNAGRFCFILGSGASVESGIPSGNELEKRWMNCIMGEAADGGIPPMDPEESMAQAKCLYEEKENEKRIEHDPEQIVAAWKQARETGGCIPSEYYFDIYKLRFYPNQRNGYRYLERLMEKSEPSIGYHVLALMLTDQYRNNLVITTNFDNLVEDALFLYTDKRPLVVSHESLACFIEPDVQRPIIAKLHRGLMYAPFNSPAATNGLREEWRETLREALRTYTPIVIGYGGGDHSLMDFLEAPDTAMSHGIYWCYRKASGFPDDAVLKLLKEKGGYLVSIDGFDALMLEIGKARYESQIIPSGTETTLKRQFDSRLKQYNEQWERLNQKPDLKPLLVPLNEEEHQAAQQRAQTDSFTVWDYVRRGNRLVEEGKHQDAIDAYTQAMELDPMLATAYYNRGTEYAVLGKRDEAIADYTKAIELNPAYAKAYNNRGASYAALGKRDKAIADFTKAIELDPAYADAYYNRGVSYAVLGKRDEAIADYNKAIELDPAYTYAYNNRGNTYAALDKRDEAIADYNKAIELDPADADAYYNRGLSYVALGKYDEAIADYTKAIDLDPAHIKAYRNRAIAYRALGKKELAQADDAKADELSASTAQ